MKIQSLHIQSFTVFEDQKFDFCDGINVFIGANATGKTHVLKAMYACALLGAELAEGRNGKEEKAKSPIPFSRVDEYFRTGSRNADELFRPGAQEVHWYFVLPSWGVELGSATGGITLRHEVGNIDTELTCQADIGTDQIKCLFVPSRESLAMFEGFASAYEKRELSFDRTYYDLCKHLSATRLKSLGQAESELIADLEAVLGGSVVLENGRFQTEAGVNHVRWILGSDGPLFSSSKGAVGAHLMAEGHRKIATLVHLLANGALDHETSLLWDEPESSLNPVLITKIAQAIQRIAESGTQVFLATHDYLLTGELSLAAEYEKHGPPVRFFAFHRENPQDPVSVEVGDTIADLQHNPIIEEFAAHYDRERAAFYRKAQAEG